MFWLVIFLISSSHAIQQTLKGPTCTNQGNIRTVGISLNSTRHPTSVWMDDFSSWIEVSNTSIAAEMDFVHTIRECEGKRIIHIRGITRGPHYQETKDKLKFHPRCGKNAAILNKGFTVQRIKIEESNNGAVFTNRPLKDNEIFQIKIEGKNSKFKLGSGIGIITKSVEEVEILDEMFKSPFAWMYYDTSLYNNAAFVTGNIGKNNYNLQVGDTMGVMRSEMGTLHFFINGEDQGPAKSNVPPNVYGVLDLRQNFHKASIV